MTKLVASDFKSGVIPLYKLTQFLPKDEDAKGPFLKVMIDGRERKSRLTRIGSDKPGIPNVGFEGFDCSNTAIQEITVIS